MIPMMNHDPLPTSADNSGVFDGDLRNFLSSEFRAQGIAVDASLAGDSGGIVDWTLSRDEFGFIVSVHGDMEAPLRDYLQSIFIAPQFSHERTRIYRNDLRKVSVMLHGPASSGENHDRTQVIVLLFSDPAIEQQISDRCGQAIEQLVTTYLTETNEWMEELQREPDPGRQAKLLDSIEARLEELIDVLERPSCCPSLEEEEKEEPN